MNTVTNYRSLKKIFLIFLLFQPILDFFLLYTDEIIEVFHFSPTTIIRTFFIGIMGVLLFFNKDKSDKKSRRILIIYGIIVGIYTLVHHIYTSNLNINNYEGFVYTFSTEMLYILRMLLPIGIIYLTYNLKLTKKEFLETSFNVLLLSSIIILSFNIFKISLKSYGEGLISGNIFDWIFNYGKIGSRELASKGWFNSANQISGLFMLLLPFAIYYFFDEFKIWKAISLFLIVLAMIALGTRTASYGWTLVFALVIAIDLFLMFVKKRKFMYKHYLSIIIIFIIGFALLKFAPVVSYEMQDSYYEQTEEADKEILELNEKLQLINSGTLSQEEIDEIIASSKCFKNRKELALDCLVKLLSIKEEYYEEIYPVEEHLDFWNNFIFKVSSADKTGNRKIQKLITYDIVKNQHSTLTPFLGYGYSRFINVKLYLEHDYWVHYYTIGIIGIIIFLAPYLIIAISSLIYMLIKRKFSFLNILMSAVILEIVGIAIITGHIMNELIVSLFIGFISGFLLYRMVGIKDEKKD